MTNLKLVLQTEMQNYVATETRYGCNPETVYLKGAEKMAELIVRLMKSSTARQEFFNRDKQGSPIHWANWIKEQLES